MTYYCSTTTHADSFMGGLYCAATTQSVPPPTLLDFFTGILMTAVISTPVWYYLRNRLQTYYPQMDEEDSSDDDDNDADVNNNDDKEDYSMHYMTEFVLLDKHTLTSEDIARLHDKTVTETADFGDIIMTYHKPTEAFWYYTDHLKEVSYTLLEAVARKFMVEHDCGGLCLGGLSLPIKANDLPSSRVSLSQGAQGGEEGLDSQAGTTPFVKFKSYNTGRKSANTNFSTGVEITNQPNHFRYKGKLYDYVYDKEELAKVKLNAQSSALPTMTYTEFVQLLAKANANATGEEYKLEKYKLEEYNNETSEKKEN